MEREKLKAMDWRTFIYPFGFLSSLAFMSRFIVQWTTSEWHKKSMVPPLFWILSLIGNLLLASHAFLQVQFHVCLIQACSAVLAIRNLNLLQPKTSQWKLQHVVIALASVALTVVLAFVLQSYLCFDGLTWIHVPHVPWSHPESISATTHLFGSLGILLFASRFWVQWWHAEKHQQSHLNATFWWLSLIGAVLSVIYFTLLGDVVNAIGPSLGLIPYIRNLMLMSREERRTANE